MRGSCVVVLLATALPGCRSDEPPASAEAVPVGGTIAATDRWYGEWLGPEGTWLRLLATEAGTQVTIRNLDGERTFTATVAGDTVTFDRDGRRETLRATNGEATGMKWLAGRGDCLTVRPGEGYCRD